MLRFTFGWKYKEISLFVGILGIAVIGRSPRKRFIFNLWWSERRLPWNFGKGPRGPRIEWTAW